MKKIFTILMFIFSIINLHSSPKSFIKLYFNDGKSAQVFCIDTIEKMKIRKFTNNFTMSFFYQHGLSVDYQTSAIDTMKFENTNFDIFLSGNKKSYLISDIDSIIFKQNVDLESVTIGNQVWELKNLDVTTYQNGDIIPQVIDSIEWANLTTGAWCYYNNDPANGAIYGKLYNWFAVNDPRGLAPLGWHVPSEIEWKTLSTYLGGDAVAGGKMKETGTAHWSIPNTNATNESGFTCLPGGYRNKSGNFASIRDGGVMWSSTEVDATIASNRILNYFNIIMYRDQSGKVYGYSIRCIKN